MKFVYVEKTFKVVVAAALALGLITALSTFASGSGEPTAVSSPTATATPR